MLSIAHAVSGAFIASTLPNPLLYAPLALACHYLEDRIYHWDFGTGMKKGVRRLWLTAAFACGDLLLAALLVALIWKQSPSSFNPHLWIGAGCAILPDLLDAPTNFLKIKPRWLAPLQNFHEKVHRSTSNMLIGLLPQGLVIAAIWFLVAAH